MGNVVRLNDYRHPPEKVGQGARVADLNDGYTRIANDLLDALVFADLTARQYKVAMAVIRKTYGYGKKIDWVGNKQLEQATGLPETRCSTVKNELIKMNILICKGRMVGINKDISQWDANLYQDGEGFTKTVKKTFTKTVKSPLPKQGNTKENITKESKENTPLPPNRGETKAAGKSEKPKAQPIPYQAVMDAYNAVAGDRLPNADTLNDKRRKAIKRLLGELKYPTVEAAAAYFQAFVERAGEFYFGENNRNWRANFDYVLRSETLVKTKEGAL